MERESKQQTLEKRPKERGSWVRGFWGACPEGTTPVPVAGAPPAGAGSRGPADSRCRRTVEESWGWGGYHKKGSNQIYKISSNP